LDRVKGKVALITGAAQNMGAADAKRLIEEGAKVMITDVLDEKGEAMAKALGPNARYLHHDVSKEADWKRVVAETEAAFGPVSVLVNNAATALKGPIETMEEADYRRIVDINQVSVFLGMKSVIPSMKRAGGGSIINISSTAGLVGQAEMLAYTATKFAVRGMTKSAAIELAPFNIRVNSVHPGVIAKPDSGLRPGLEEYIKQLASMAPAARIANPDEIATVVLLLASDECRFATGAEFVVDGGQTCQ